MGWRGLLRVVDFQALLSSQSLVASALDKAQHAGGTKSPEAKALREGYHLLAKVLWTRRASIQRIHDLAWLDHTVVSAAARASRRWSLRKMVYCSPAQAVSLPPEASSAS